MSSAEVKALVSPATVTVTGDVSGEESSSSTYGTVQDSIVMAAVPSDSSDAEFPADDPNRRLVQRVADTSVSSAAARSTT